jgi:hypothetical protein
MSGENAPIGAEKSGRGMLALVERFEDGMCGEFFRYIVMRLLWCFSARILAYTSVHRCLEWRLGMRHCTAVVLGFLTALQLTSCGQKESEIEVDPQLGRQCFDAHIDALPSGTQYEGIERAVAGRLTIRVMTGVELTSVECELDPDGTLRTAKE